MNGDFSLDALRTYVAELIATFFLVWVGTGAIIVNDATGGSITHPGVAASFGLIVMIMIYSFGSISGAHMNPAVSIGFFVIRQLSLIRLLGYLLAQICGALIASLSWRVLFRSHGTLGATLPNMELSGADPVVASVFAELMLTALLMLVILAVTHRRNEAGKWAGLVIGALIGLEALFGGPICGASMNPARSLGPAIVSLNFQYLWIYVAAPIGGAVAASLFGPWLFGWTWDDPQ